LSTTAAVIVPVRSSLWLRIISRLPWKLLYALTAILAFVLRYVLHYRVGVARSNLRRCFPTCSPLEI